MIIRKRINQGSKRLQIVRPEQRPPRRDPLEVVHCALIRPGCRQTANPLLTDNAAHQRNTTRRHAPQRRKRLTRPRMERMGHLNDSRRLSRQFL